MRFCCFGERERCADRDFEFCLLHRSTEAFELANSGTIKQSVSGRNDKLLQVLRYLLPHSRIVPNSIVAYM